MAIRTTLQHQLYRLLHPLVRAFLALGISPNAVTTIGLVLNLVVAGVFILGAEEAPREDFSYIGWGGFLILFAGLFDMIDGQVARTGNRISRFGALYDSVIDRYSELFMFLGICYYLVAHHYFFSSMIAFVALIGSMMVSYTRARAEGLGIPCKDGLMQRPERIVIIGCAALLCSIVAHWSGTRGWNIDGFRIETISLFTVPLAVVAVLANYTAFQRLAMCYRYLQNEHRKP